jgi:hypothetical protein
VLRIFCSLHTLYRARQNASARHLGPVTRRLDCALCAGGNRLQGMNLKEKAAVISSLALRSDLLKYSAQERKEMLEGGSILMDLDWPSNYIVGLKICRRAIQGLVPRYEDYQSFRDYENRWRSEDQN